ncbi:competence protein ComK [Amedibacterium intestinale]|uniref:Competence protein ComK n=2 Tax=Amedibacterium intestinale TaxID=2583452 RepID=A0A6N4TG79_9FIRM|nr:competence protein ComK [Amedibacterium intestinale]BBK21990.1 hypothetical protein Aargi30884_08930 [Amedibacterium intestinale]BBK62072.1 hypothetical protein A9CBEGH2_10120 [Amedibacterium intestinale]
MIYAILDQRDEGKILREDHVVFWKQGSIHFLETWCLQHGSTLRGRLEASRYILHSHQRVPVLISEATKDLMFPCKALSSKENVWINYRGVFSYTEEDKQIVFEFLNGEKIKVDTSMHCVKRSMLLCEKYMEYLYAYT